MNLQIKSEEGYSGHLTMPDDSQEFVEDYVISKLPFLEGQTFYIIESKGYESENKIHRYSKHLHL